MGANRSPSPLNTPTIGNSSHHRLCRSSVLRSNGTKKSERTFNDVKLYEMNSLTLKLEKIVPVIMKKTLGSYERIWLGEK